MSSSRKMAMAKALQQRGMTMGVFVASMPKWAQSRPILGATDGAEREAFLSDIRKSIDVAKRLSATRMTVVTGFMDPRVPLDIQTARVIDTPGHTVGHIAFWFEAADALFCGDTLFALGCGRLFEGTPSQMWRSLCALRALPDATRVYCGHEYTLSNARFAVTVHPANGELERRFGAIKAMRERGEPTIPSTLAEERRTNPFLRADDAQVQAAVGMAGADPAEVFAELRRRKDGFR